MKTRKVTSFEYEYEGNRLEISEGYAFAYGYVAYAPSTTLYFNRTSATQYHIVYLEIDKSVIPNLCAIKVKNNQASNIIKPSTLRQDILSIVKTGVFQLPLFIVELNSKGIVSVQDKRLKTKYIKQVNLCEETGRITEQLLAGAYMAEQPEISEETPDKMPSTVLFVHNAIQHYLKGGKFPPRQV